MSAILATFYNPNKPRKEASSVAIAVGTAAAASFLLYQAYNVTVASKKDGGKKPLPRAPMGMLATIRMIAGQSVPMQLLEIAKELDSWTFELNLSMPGHPKVVVVSEAEDVNEILRDSLTYKPRAIYGQTTDISPTKSPFLFSLPLDEEWHRRRKGTAPAFSQKHVRRMNQVAVKQTENWLQGFVAPMAAKGESFDMTEELLKLIMKAFAETALEYDMSDEEIDTFLTEWDLVAKEYILKSATNPFRKYLEAFLPDRRRAKQATLNIHELVYRIIDNYKKLESPIEGTVLDLVMKNSTYKGDHERASEIFAFMVGGHDTTAITLSFILMELAKNPDEQLSLRKALSNMKPEDWSKTELLKNVVREGMRMHPVAANTVTRAVGRDMTTKENHFLPKGTMAFLPLYLVFRNNDVFEDPDVFRPSRWENPTELMKRAFVPFVLGKQNCIGQSLANAETHCVLARMIQEFDFSVVDEGHPESSLVFRQVGLRMKATRAK